MEFSEMKRPCINRGTPLGVLYGIRTKMLPDAGTETTNCVLRLSALLEESSVFLDLRQKAEFVQDSSIERGLQAE
jgi:hypothetical protein